MLCPTTTVPPRNSASAGSTACTRGAGATIAAVMPVSTVMAGGMAEPGLTNVWKVPRHSPPRTLTAPISVMASSLGEPPVVSRSTTAKVTSASGVPSSSKDRCTGGHGSEQVFVRASIAGRISSGSAARAVGTMTRWTCPTTSSDRGWRSRSWSRSSVPASGRPSRRLRRCDRSCSSRSCRPPRWPRSARWSRTTSSSASGSPRWPPTRPSTGPRGCGCTARRAGRTSWRRSSRRSPSRPPTSARPRRSSGGSRRPRPRPVARAPSWRRCGPRWSGRSPPEHGRRPTRPRRRPGRRSWSGRPPAPVSGPSGRRRSWPRRGRRPPTRPAARGGASRERRAAPARRRGPTDRRRRDGRAVGRRPPGRT